eukprot:TRINITY_DN2206_c0_g1_i3.p1 TRINITY_DN2206_c0_g1~~TRINITY_DN2206_c0_g1_i3.p1  ORF type:complete len:584 (+),score=107.86 TRINITY_DN2206_c0_g1_i3:85-1836(+)
MLPKRGNETETPRTACLEYIRENVMTDEEGEELCFRIMQDVVAQAEEQMIGNYLDRTAIPYTVQTVCKELLDLMQFVFVARDPGDDSTEASRLVAVRRGAPAADGRHLGPRRRPAAAAAALRRRPRTGCASAGCRQKASPKGTQPAASPASPPPPGSGRQSMGTPSAGPVSDTRRQPRLSRPSAVPTSAERRDSAATDRDDERGGLRGELRRRQEQREAAERQHAQLRETKAKDFCVDSIGGRVIAVRPADPERLPGKRLDVRVQVEGDLDERPPPEPEKKPGRGARGAPSAGRKGKRRADGRAKWGEFLQPEDSHGPLVEGCQPAGGVMLKEGDRTVRADLKVSKQKMSREDFRKMLAAQGVVRETTEMSAEDGPRSGDAGPAAAAGTAAGRGRPQQQPTQSQPGRRLSRTPAAGGGPQAVQQQQQQQPWGSAAAAAAATADAKGDGQKAPAVYKPQGVAQRPQFKARLSELLGKRQHYPRDRHPQRSPRHEESPGRVHPLPPPVYPGLEGHGVVTGELGKDNPYAAQAPTADGETPRSRSTRPTRAGTASPRPAITVNPNGVQGNDAAEDFLADVHGDESP